MSLPIPIWGVPISVWGLPFFCFFQSRTRSAFSHQTDNNTANTSTAIPIFNARDASGRTPLESARAYASSGRGAPRSSQRALTPRCPPTRPKRRGRGFGRGGGRGGRGPIGRLACACWSAPPPPPTSLVTVPRRRRRCRRVWGGCLFVPGGELNEIKKSKKTRLCYGRLAKHNNQPKTHARDAGGKCEEVRPVRSEGGARFDRWGR